jgi:hypothetical protein
MSKAFTRQTFCWLRQINHDKRVGKVDLALAVELTRYFNEKDHGGRAWPGAKTLADAIGVHEVTVLRSGQRLQAAGHLHIVPGRQGCGHTHQYWMKLEPASEQVLKPAGAQVKKPAPQSKKPARAQENLLRNQGEVKSIDLNSPREREDRLRGLESPSPGGAPDGRAPEYSQEDTQASSLSADPIPSADYLPKESEDAQTSSADSLAREREERSLSAAKTSPPSKPDSPKEGFAELRRIWARPWPDDLVAAGKAYAVAAAEVGSDVILAGARAWVTACDAPRYLPALTKWLSARCWEKPPPQRRARSAPRQQRRSDRKPDLARRMLALGEEG